MFTFKGVMYLKKFPTYKVLNLILVLKIPCGKSSNLLLVKDLKLTLTKGLIAFKIKMYTECSGICPSAEYLSN